MTEDVFGTWVREHLGVPTEIQALAWPKLRAGGNALLVAPTGTGKTEAAMVPLLEECVRERSEPVSVIYVTPLRALNRDLENRLMAMASAAGITARARHGDTPSSERTRQSRQPPHLLITTPETLQILLIGKNLRKGLADVRTVVIDEVHELASSDRGAQLALSVERLERLVGRPVRRIGLSATISNPEEMARFISYKVPAQVIISREGKRFELDVRASSEAPDPGTPDHPGGPPLTAEGKLRAAASVALQIIQSRGATLVFSNTRPGAETLTALLRQLAPDMSVSVHHGSLSRFVREEAEVEFRSGATRALVATSSLELGIDVGVIDHVVQVGSPHRVARLVQRVGRAGHSAARTSSGTVITIDDSDLEEAAVIARRALQGQVEEVRVRRKNLLALGQQVVALLREKGESSVSEILDISTQTLATSDLSKQEVEDLLGALEGHGLLHQDAGRIWSGRGLLKHFYSNLSLIPEERSFTLRDIATRRVIGTLDERFVVTRVLSTPDHIFLLRGTTWKMVSLTGDELMVEAVQEMGTPPYWEGDDIPVPLEVASEMGSLRRLRSLETYPLSVAARTSLQGNLERHSQEVWPTDQRITVEVNDRLLIIGSCNGTNVNNTLAVLLTEGATSLIGMNVVTLLVTPTWLVLRMPLPASTADAERLFQIDPDSVGSLLSRGISRTEDYRWTFVVVARKLGLLPAEFASKEHNRLDPLLETHRDSVIGQETFSKVVHDKFDIDNTRLILQHLREGSLVLSAFRGTGQTPGAAVLERLKWSELPSRPPPSVLRTIRERLEKEELMTICLRCGNPRVVTPRSYPTGGSSPCIACHAVLTAVISPRRKKEIETIRKYVSRKRHLQDTGGFLKPKERERKVLSAAHASAELLATYGFRALMVLAGRGIGPGTARRILSRGYEDLDDLLAEILRAEKNYARTREFWD